MWNFIKSVYCAVRNAVALAFVKTVNYSMSFIGIRKERGFIGFLKGFFSFFLFCVAVICLKIVIGLVFSAIVAVFSTVLGVSVATLIAFVATVMFAIDLFETIDFFRTLDNAFGNIFGKEAVFA